MNMAGTRWMLFHLISVIVNIHTTLLYAKSHATLTTPYFIDEEAERMEGLTDLTMHS